MAKPKFVEVSENEKPALRAVEQAMVAWMRATEAAVAQDPALRCGLMRQASLSLERASRLLREAAEGMHDEVMEWHNNRHPLRRRHLMLSIAGRGGRGEA